MEFIPCAQVAICFRSILVSLSYTMHVCLKDFSLISEQWLSIDDNNLIIHKKLSIMIKSSVNTKSDGHSLRVVYAQETKKQSTS